MLVYWTIAIITVLINLFPIKSQKQYSLSLLVSFLLLFLFAGFRINYGLDYISYLDYFNDVKIFGHEANERMELGYYYLNKILPSFRSLLILQSLLMCIAYYYLFKNFIPSKYAWLGFLILYLNPGVNIVFMLDGIRNGMAISIFILSINFIYNHKIIPFVLLMYIAYLLHESVFLVAPFVYFIANGKPIAKRSLIVWVVVIISFSIVYVTFLFNYLELFINTYMPRYSTYLESAKEQSKNAGFLISLFSVVSALILLFLVKNKKLTAKENMIIKLSLLFFVSFLLGPLNVRFSQYFAPFFIVGSIVAIDGGSNKHLKIIYLCLIFIYMSYSLYLWYNNSYFAYKEYQSIF